MDKNLIGKSKLLSLILRHKPEQFKLTLDNNGWVNINDLLSAINNKTSEEKHTDITIENIIEIVDKNDKKRFQISDNGKKIRAVQGHSASLNIDVELKKCIPPPVLFHGTNDKALYSITQDGISKMNRHHVHLTDNVLVAIDSGRRKGKPVVLVIDTKRMVNDNIPFFVSLNGIFFTDHVDTKYIRVVNCDSSTPCAGIIVINPTNKKCLLVKANEWGFPKGKKNIGEHLLQCALRELDEETSLSFDDIKIDFFAPILYEKSYNGNNAVALFVAYTNKTIVAVKDTDELSDIKWFDFKDALQVLDGVKNRADLLKQAISHTLK